MLVSTEPSQKDGSGRNATSFMLAICVAPLSARPLNSPPCAIVTLRDDSLDRGPRRQKRTNQLNECGSFSGTLPHLEPAVAYSGQMVVEGLFLLVMHMPRYNITVHTACCLHIFSPLPLGWQVAVDHMAQRSFKFPLNQTEAPTAPTRLMDSDLDRLLLQWIDRATHTTPLPFGQVFASLLLT